MTAIMVLAKAFRLDGESLTDFKNAVATLGTDEKQALAVNAAHELGLVLD